MQHPTSFFGLSRRANTRHLLFLCLASTFLAAASLYSSLSSFAVQAAGTEGNGGRHAMYTAGASGISGERQQGEQDETALLTGRMYDGEQDQVDAQEAPMELQERSQSHSRSKSDGFFEYGYRSPRLQKKKKMSLLTHLLPALAFVVILNLGAAAVYLHSQKKSLEQLPVQTDAELEKAVTEEAADVAPTPVAPTPVAPTPTEAKATIAKLKETVAHQQAELQRVGRVGSFELRYRGFD